MSGAALSRDGDQLVLAGELGFETVDDLLAQGEALLPASGDVVLDLAGVTGVDSAGVALLLDWVAAADRRGARLVIRNAPDKLGDIARICEVESLLAGAGPQGAASWADSNASNSSKSSSKGSASSGGSPS